MAVSPTTGAPGRGVTVSGSNWTAGDTIFIQIGSTVFDTDVACTLIADSDGAILGNQPNGGCQVPNVPAGARTVFAVDEQNQSMTATGSSSFTVTPVLILTPANSSAGAPASPGVTVSVTGRGFAASSSVSGFKFDGGALTTSPTSRSTDSNGSFTSSVTFTVPSSTAAAHTVAATDGTHTGSASLRVYVPHVGVSPTTGAPGRGLTVSGSGWNPGDTVFVQIGSSVFDTDVACTLTVSSDATIAGTQSGNSCQVPNVPAGARTVTAIDEQQQGLVATGSSSFTVTPVLILTPANSSAGAPASPGVTVTVTGHGFGASTTVSGFKFDGVALTTSPTSMSTDGNGNFTTTVTFTVPSATAATHTVTATDGTNTGSASLRVYVPHVGVSPTTGPPGRGLTVSGSGWNPGDTVFVQIGSSVFDTNVACALTASSDGTIAGTQSGNSCQVPNVPAGARTVTAIDEQNPGVVATGSSSFTVTPVLTLTPANSSAGAPASPGVTMTLTGRGFGASTTVSGFKFDGVALTTSPTSMSTDGNGNFTSSVTFTVPSTTAANHTVTATDGTHTGSASLRVYVPHVSVSPTSGGPGRGLTVTGFGWNPGDTVFVQIGSSVFDTDVACALTASTDGTIAGTQSGNSCQVPNVPAGARTVTAIDEQQQGLVATGSSSFTVTPVLILTPANSSAGAPASPGVTVTVTGHGFGASTTVSGFKFDGVALTTSPTSMSTDSSGNFTTTVTFTVPSTTAASHTVTATDGTHTGSGSLKVFVPHISVSPGSGVPGRGLRVTGSGWQPGDTIFIQIGSNVFDTDVACSLTVSSDGTIAGNQSNGGCHVPSVATGSQPLVAIDEQNQGVVAIGTAFTVT